ncbi:pancreatic secretory granule membrane major glycoprotein GP2-like [Triplophysa dalaica]|uniref:pancreatic secretory granule membrane major glycoprotein GP2-like n=1 Tax=Triplophysa dalaica TaxID=1582913 RepID=UPI0024DF60EC|nr:pancreatic secretory granule membrane major glycoprotein GP2-like [Triplophysa dalaica]
MRGWRLNPRALRMILGTGVLWLLIVGCMLQLSHDQALMLKSLSHVLVQAHVGLLNHCGSMAITHSLKKVWSPGRSAVLLIGMDVVVPPIPFELKLVQGVTMSMSLSVQPPVLRTAQIKEINPGYEQFEVPFTSPNVDPCDSYTTLDDVWRSSSNYNYYYKYNYGTCDYNLKWNGWYRLFLYGQDAQMPESCVISGSCGTSQPLWLNGHHPQPEEGVVNRQVCTSNWYECFCYSTHSIHVKACPGDYFVYELVSPTFCSAYCTGTHLLHNYTTSSPTTESTTSVSTTIDPCAEVNCTDGEWCGEKDGIYGCLCSHPKSNPDSYDSFEICENSSGFFSLSRCQLFEDGFSSEVLHLRDPYCKGTVRDGRVEFRFDSNNLCGTNLVANGTHFIYENVILGNVKSTQLISRNSYLNMTFSCIYSQTQAFSMNAKINPLESYLHKMIPASQGTYRVRMVPYQDPQFSQPFNGSVNIEVNQLVFVEVNVDGIDGQQFALLIDTCWATPVNDPLYHVRWDLIIGECPNSKDGTIDLVQNGVSTSSRFSFRMFSFTENSDTIFLHCSIHLCLLQDNDCSVHCASYRRRRSVDYYDSSSISIGPLKRSLKTIDTWVSDRVEVSRASALCGSLMAFFLFVLSIHNIF